MDPADIIRFADAVHRERGIDKEVVFTAIEQGLLTAARKRFGEEAVIEVQLDRRTGEIRCLVNGRQQALEFGRIAAQTARQVMSQRIREAERDKNLDEYNRRLGSIVTGAIQRIESGNLIVNMGRVEGIVPRSEQIRGETFKVGDRIRAYLFEVRPQGQRVRIVLSRSRPEFVKKLFALEVPEISDGVIEIKSIEREAGYKTKLAVESLDRKVDPIGACVGVRGSRIRNIIDELNGETVDILKWEELGNQHLRGVHGGTGGSSRGSPRRRRGACPRRGTRRGTRRGRGGRDPGRGCPHRAPRRRARHDTPAWAGAGRRAGGRGDRAPRPG